jgi:hypothetical protein
LFEALSNVLCTPAQVAKKRHAKYLAGYLSTMHARTIVVEHEYVDGDYLDDFASYYVKCFAPYQRLCKRAHFFSHSFDKSDFLQLVKKQLMGGSEERISESYLGFCVARPLPDAIVGRTVLRTYPHDGRRYYTVTRTYSVNLFGLPLKLDSLAFQEQDTVMAACATVALWCSFQKTGTLFQSAVPTPAAITRAANQVADDRRPLPSHGLRIEQICNAIKYVGLEPEVIPVSKRLPLASLLYGYLRFGIPIVLVVEIKGQGLHAVTLTGYSLRSSSQGPQEAIGAKKFLPMVGRRIDEFYAHDDQVGPFASLPIIRPSKDPRCPIHFAGWGNPKTGKAHDFLPRAVVAPVYGKVRLTFTDIQKWLERLTNILRLLSSSPFEWDVHLALSNERKVRIRAGHAEYDDETLDRVLLNQHPRFAWRASYLSGVVRCLTSWLMRPTLRDRFPSMRLSGSAMNIETNSSDS